MEKRIFTAVVAKAAISSQTAKRNDKTGIAREVEVKGAQITFTNICEGDNDVTSLPHINNNGEDIETTSIFIPWCKLIALFDITPELQFPLFIRGIEEFIEYQRMLCLAILKANITIISTKYEVGENTILNNEKAQIIRQFIGNVDMSKYNMLADKLTTAAEKAAAKEEEKAAITATKQNAAVFGTV